MADQRGFTLIELLIAMVLAMMVLSAGYSVFYGSGRAATMQTQDTRMQDNARMAMDVLARSYRMAGLNVKFSNYPNGTATVDGSLFGEKLLHTDHDDAPDSVTVLGASMGTGWQTSLANSANQGDQSFTVKDASQINAGDIIAIGLEHTAIVKQVNKLTGAVTLETLGLSLPAATLNMNFQGPAAGKTAAAVTLVKSVALNIADDKYGMPVLYMNNQPLAEGIEDLQIEYGVDRDDDRIIQDGEWFSTPDNVPVGGAFADLRSKVRLVRITLVARTEREDPALRGQSRCVPSDCVSKIGNREARKNVTDGYRRFILTREVKCRNMDVMETL